jgi:hypothetical protein
VRRRVQRHAGPGALGLDLRAGFGLGAPILVLRVQVEGVRMEAGDEDGS